MGREKLRIGIPVIVEGKYDKAKLAGVIDGVIVATDGFAVFRNEEKRALIRRLGERGVILLSDSDGGGRVIRSHLRGMLAGIPVYDLYTPALPGKEPRKASRSRAGILGVEGVPDETLRAIFEAFLAKHPELGGPSGDGTGSADADPVTPALLYELGLNGVDGASERRAEAAERMGLPRDMTVKAFCAAASYLTTGEKLRRLMEDDPDSKTE